MLVLLAATTSVLPAATLSTTSRRIAPVRHDELAATCLQIY